VHLLLLEFVNCHLAVVNGDKLDQLAEVLDVDIRGFNLGLQVQDVLLLARLGLEERLHGGLAKAELFELFLVAAALVLTGDLFFHDRLAAFDRVNHTLDVEHFTLDPEGGLSEG